MTPEYKLFIRPSLDYLTMEMELSPPIQGGRILSAKHGSELAEVTVQLGPWIPDPRLGTSVISKQPTPLDRLQVELGSIVGAEVVILARPQFVDPLALLPSEVHPDG